MNADKLVFLWPALLFVDMSGFTTMMETLSAKGLKGVEQISGHLNDYFGQLVRLLLLFFIGPHFVWFALCS